MDCRGILEGLAALELELGPDALVVDALASGYSWRYGSEEVRSSGRISLQWGDVLYGASPPSSPL